MIYFFCVINGRYRWATSGDKRVVDKSTQIKTISANSEQRAATVAM